MKKIIVTGAQFSNKGAQSLLFCFVSSIRDKIPDCEILYFPLDIHYPYDQENIKIQVIRNTSLSHHYEAGGLRRCYAVCRYVFNKIVCQEQNIHLGDITALSNCLKSADVMVDLSGYNLGSKWSIETNKNYLRYFMEAHKHGIPVVLFPQSFGPFDYGEEQNEMDALIQSVLSGVDAIFAREKEGYELLTTRYHLQNVQLSPDFVLTSDIPKWENLYYSEPGLGFKKVHKKNVVGVIPNYQNFIHGSHKEVLKIYIYLIKELLAIGKKIVIFRHSEDLEVCREIYSVFHDEPDVELYEYGFSSFEYSKFIKEFDFLVAARYHSIVHAYKIGIPVVALGWAIKYQELTTLFQQQKYLINTALTVDHEMICKVVRAMNQNYVSEKSIILKTIADLHSTACIDEVMSILKQTLS